MSAPMTEGTANRVSVTEDFLSLFQRITAEVALRNDVLDVGAGLEAPWGPAIQKRAHRLVLLDAHQPYLDANQTRGPNVERVCLPIQVAVEKLPYRDSEFDVAMAIDFIEHLDTVDAHKAIRWMQRIARKVLVFTPDGHSPQDHDVYEMGADHWQTHRSEWSVERLQALGFDAILLENFHGAGQSALWGIWRKP